MLSESLTEKKFVKLTLGKYRGPEDGAENIYFEQVIVGEEIRMSLRYKYKTKDIFKNLDFDQSVQEVEAVLGSHYLFGSLFTIEHDYVIEYNKRREPKSFSRRPSFNRVQIKSHNKVKTRFINSRAKYLHLLGITNDKGEIKSDKYYKFKQIDKFIEIVDSLFRDSHLADKEKIKVADYGSGKSYLTFAIHDYFVNKLRKNTETIGIEERAELTDLSNSAAAECDFSGLQFITGTILDIPARQTDIVTALHACDTATDDAIAKALQQNAEIIILAPCCQKYVRNEMKIPASLKSIFNHGIFEEHIASFVTDGLRSLMLESFGYKTKVFEFISQEHTSKNIMITAVKHELDPVVRKEKLAEIEQIKSEFGLKDFYLDKII